MFKKVGITASVMVAFFSTQAAQAALNETAWQYAQTCVQELELIDIPSFTCDASTSEFVPTVSGGSWVGTIDTGNPDVDAVFFCRTSGNTTRGGLNGLIIHNKALDKACFFDAEHSNISTPMISLTSSNQSAVNNAWYSPSAMAARNDGKCQNCHGNDPIIASTVMLPALTNLGLMNNGRKLTGPVYHVVGDDLADWNNQLEQAISNNSNTCAQACHRMSNNMDGSASMPPTGAASGYAPYITSLPIFSDFDPGDPQVLFPAHISDGEPWFQRVGRTPSGGSTGPRNSWDTHIHIETSSYGGTNPMYFWNNRAMIETYPADLTNTTVSLDYHMYGADIGLLAIDIWSNLFNGWMSVSGREYGNDPNWQHWSVDLSGYSFVMGGLSKVRIRANAKGGWRGDIAIDNFRIEKN